MKAFLSKTNTEIKLGTLYFNNMNNVEARYEVLERMNVMENFIAGEEMHNVKDYLSTLIVDDMILFVEVE